MEIITALDPRKDTWLIGVDTGEMEDVGGPYESITLANAVRFDLVGKADVWYDAIEGVPTEWITTDHDERDYMLGRYLAVKSDEHWQAQQEARGAELRAMQARELVEAIEATLSKAEDLTS